MAKSSKEVSERALEAIRMAKQNGTVKKGINEVTKSVERNLASLVVIAEDVEPQEVIMHIPTLCEQKKIAIAYVPTKQELGNAVGINVPCSAISIEKAGSAGEQALKEVVSKITGKSAPEPSAPKPQQSEAPKREPKPEKPKKEKTAQAPKPSQPQQPLPPKQ